MAKAIEGKDGFLFLTNDNNNIMQQTTGQYVMPDSHFEQVLSRHDERIAVCRSVGASYRHVIVPNKETVYRAFLPEEFQYEKFGPTPVRKFTEQTRPSQDIAWFRPEALRQLIDRGAMPYRRCDTHWTDSGAYSYLVEILREANHALELDALLRTEFDSSIVGMKGDLDPHANRPIEQVNRLTIRSPKFAVAFSGQCRNEGYVRHQRSLEPGAKRRALLLHDSFSQWLFPFFGQIYDEVLSIHCPDLDLRLVQQFCPDHVWFIQVERFFTRLPRNGIDIVAAVRQQEAAKGVSTSTSEYLCSILTSQSTPVTLPMPLINVAQGKPATQSSYSRWSTESEASQAVSGSIQRSFAFHTDFEDRPWWQVDLLGIYPIESIVIHNRLDGFAERARTLRVQLSEDGEVWRLVHAGLAFFSGGASGPPLTLTLNGIVSARLVRLSLDEKEYFHLAKVEVFVFTESKQIIDFRDRHGITDLNPRKLIGLKKNAEKYQIEQRSKNINVPIIGLKLLYVGRFGNMLIQYINAILIAEKGGLKYVQLGQHELSDPIAPIHAGSLTFLPSNVPLPEEGAFLTGAFFAAAFTGASASEAEKCRVAREIIRPHLLTGLGQIKNNSFQDFLAIHIRSGDLFADGNAVHAGYRQPPLSFYILVIRRLLANGTINRVLIVYEDRGNPCVDALEEYLTAEGIQFRSQSGTLAEDLSALVDAPHLVFGLGTFGYAVCRLSTRIQTVHYFAPSPGVSYESIPGIDKVYSVHDREGSYIKVGDWHNTAEQRRLMCSYPVDALEVREFNCSR
ncbi:discoidin domain-containing protein [Methylocapsa aurea]|uniref:discoidin domain-containing protein n=1 Tax=Methylocapsa aurea TaxID=663610 RepID=UPI00068C3A6B|nr:discoidin domain-containing protein [Methylocapsa aurea]